jgi:glycosyltransferase involved in cell wall biosynthesis
MSRVNVHLYQSTFTHESRILRITHSLAKAALFDKILIVVRGDGNLAARQWIDSIREVHRIRARFWSVSKFLGLLEWLIRATWHVLATRPCCVNAHSLPALPIGVAAKWVCGARLVYDTHELETEAATLQGIRKWLYKFVERALIRYADEVVVVGPAIAGWYSKQYALQNVHVVRNFPLLAVEPTTAPMLRRELGISSDDIVFLYQGVTGVGRGIELLLRVFQNVSRDKHLVVIGYGQLAKAIEDAAKDFRQIHFVPAVAPSVLPQWTAGADVGLSVIENICLSYYYCLPNKIFEYLACGIPIIASDFPEMARLVDDLQCGWTVPVQLSALQRLIDGMTRQEIDRKKEAAITHRASCRWEVEESALLRMYQKRGGPRFRNAAA